jgi:hypothetical protein
MHNPGYNMPSQSIYYEIFRDVGKRARRARHPHQPREAFSAVTNKSNSEVSMDRLVEVCKSLNAGECTPPTEHELTAEIQKYASAHRRDGETSARAFSRILTGDDEIGLTFRKSLAVCKRAAGFPL